MFWIIIPIVLIVVMGVFSVLSLKNAKSFYTEQSEEDVLATVALKEKVTELVRSAVPDVSDYTLINGHFATQLNVGVKVLTYYSYAILCNSSFTQFVVVSYNHDKNAATSMGVFAKDAIEAIDVNNGFQTNFKIKDESGKVIATIHTLGHEMPSEDEFQIKYFQEAEYNALRGAFGLSAYSYAAAIRGEQ